MHSNTIEHYKKNLKLTKEQRELIVGTLLGDAHLERRYKGYTFSLMVEHLIKQKEYVEWKYNALKEWVRTPPRMKRQVVNGKQYDKYCFRTLGSSSFRFYHAQFYRNGKKVVPKLIHRWLTPYALCIWFMDDGSIKSKYHRARIINTQGFDKQDVLRLIHVLQNKFHIAARVRKQKEGYQIYLLAETIDHFANLVRPYIIPSMSYKLQGLS